MSVVVTANAFRSGEVIYWGKDGWVDDLSLASVFTAADAEAVIKQAEATPDKVVGVYAIDVKMTNNAAGQFPTPSHIREIIRAGGPSNYDHGKDKEGRKGHVSL